MSGSFPPPSRRVVVTGLGPLTAAGIGVKCFWEGLQGNVSPVSLVTRFDASTFRSRIAAEVHDFEATHYMERGVARRLDRFGQFAVASVALALEDACLDPGSLDPERVAVQMGSALGGLGHAEGQVGVFLKRGLRAVDPRIALTTFAGAASCHVAIQFGFQGPNMTNAMSCASGTIAVGEAWRLIGMGAADVAIAGGAEAPLAPLSYGAFANIRAMSRRNDEPERACRPFDRDRDGFVMGEGACSLILEERESALARGAHIYAEIIGYGNTNDAYHMTAPRPEPTQSARAMCMAMERGGLQGEDVGYINAHGSSTPLNDSTESQAIRCAIGPYADSIPVSGTKAFYGHALGASGAIEAAICCLTLDRQWIPPTLNLHEPGAGCDLNYVAHRGRDATVRTALSNSFGFGGINACLALRTGETEA